MQFITIIFVKNMWFLDMEKMKLIFLSLVFISLQVAAQSTAKADRYFDIRNYSTAVKIYEEAIIEGEQDPIVHMKAGLCYAMLSGVNTQLKGIKYLEYAYQNKTSQIPSEVNYYLAILYHKDMQIEKALKLMMDYKEEVPSSDKARLQEVDRYLELFNNALIHSRDPKDVQIKKFSNEINTYNTEYNPVVSADERIMAFTALRKDESKPASSSDLIEQVLISKKQAMDVWSTPEVVSIRTQYNVGTAGISPDGNRMLIFIGDGTSGDIYEIENQGDKWGEPAALGSHVNSRHLETTASITPDGKRVFFASNRPGGQGGLDIYMVEKTVNEKWGNPVNLGPAVNTPYDDDAPFIHPDGKTLFFTSEGHNTMGGKDIFKSIRTNRGWQTAVNMGYPVNTTANDNYFTLTADGSKGFFSSDRKGGAGGQDLYYFNMPEDMGNVPLTLIKGKILAGEESQPVPTKIKVVDNATKEKIDYVYNPNSKTGNYLIIFPPGKDYDMIIEAEGYMPYTMNISIPNQDYFYELYQQIHLYPIRQFDEVVGQEVSVRNAFYDTEDSKEQIQKSNDAMLVQSDSIDLYDLMDAVMSSNDTAAFEYLLDLMYEVNPIEDVNFEESEEVESAETSYFYDENEDKLEMRIIDGDTIYSLPTFYVSEEAQKQKESKKAEKKKSYDALMLGNITKVYFETAKSEVDPSFESELAKVLGELKQHNDLAIEISGYASSEGNAEYNRELSNKRATAVLKYFTDNSISRRRIAAKGYGATTAASGNSKESRRVEIKLIDIEDVN